MADRRPKRLARAPALALLAGLLTGCGFLAVPAPKEAVAPAAAPVAAAPAPAAAPGTVIVQPGDSVYSIARRNNTPIRAIIEANHLEPPFALRAGQTLLVPHPQTYVVRPGDALYAVARQNNVDSSELVRANDLKPPYRLIIGQTLILPGTIASEPSAAPIAPATSDEVQRVELLPPPGSTNAPAANAVVASTSSTSEGGVITTVPLAPPPQLQQPQSQPEQVPQTPPQQGPETAASGSTPPVVVVPSPPPAAVTDYAAPAKTGEAAETPAAAAPPSAGTKLAALPPAGSVPAGPGGASGGRFIWPVRGKIISGYGQKEGGLFNDGINIAVKEGTPVVAADEGAVVYAGNEIRGFGNLVLIKHANGWMTAYAHNKELLVRRGEEVRRGQMIARAGSSGTTPIPQLHFEIRRGSRAVDPMKYLEGLSS
ncbi:MAG TPA: LysM peptidoglycan-binding domain-containing M23 family metallopeptidase [Alphaproteobacteria bacterium]|nr:LysM peptidoglycan-binding domain-containing M23 family metallopeptidase [Alphaproteobacteria bacterium]